jgi:tetratricopeptide (TPR) repeat protein
MDNPTTQLAAFLRKMRLDAGDPSTREIAKMTGAAISHTAVHQLLSGHRAGRWGAVELIVEALCGDVTEAREMWRKARQFEAETRRNLDAPTSRLPHKNYTPGNSYYYNWAHTYAVHSVASRHFEKREYELALELVKREIDRTPERYCTSAHMLYAEILIEQKGPTDALSELAENCKSRTAHDPEVANYFAYEIYAEVEDFESAIRFGKQAVHLDPENGDYHWRLALYLSDIGADAEEVLKYLRRAHKAAPSEADFASRLMEALIVEGLYSEAESVGRAYTPRPDTRPGFYWEVPFHFGKALALQGKLDEAAEALRAEAERGNIHVVLERARVLHHSGDANGAIQQLRIELRPKNAAHAAKIEILRILKAEGRNGEADKIVTELASALADPDAWDRWH